MSHDRNQERRRCGLCRKILRADVEALARLTTTTKDRAQFEKAFGPLYVVPTETGGACCAPRG